METETLETMTIREVAAVMNLSRAQIYNRMHSGDLRGRVSRERGRSIYVIEAASVEEVLRQEREESEGTGVFLSAAQVARRLGMSLEAVRAMARSGILRGTKTRSTGLGKWWFHRDVVDAWAAKARESRS